MDKEYHKLTKEQEEFLDECLKELNTKSEE